MTLPLIAALPRMERPTGAQVEALMDTAEPDDAQIAEVIRR